MSFEEFKNSLAGGEPPVGVSAPLSALWRDAKDDWEGAHLDAQGDGGRDGSWVHAYLHRKEGDLGNAGYWYSRAGQSMPAKTVTLAAEWAEIVKALLAR